MKEEILKIITDQDCVSFVELQNKLGDKSRGDFWIEMPEGSNVFLWMGVSEEFSAALRELKDVIVPASCSVLVYIADGALPNIPVVKRFPKKGASLKGERWLPVVFRLRSRVKQTGKRRG